MFDKWPGIKSLINSVLCSVDLLSAYHISDYSSISFGINYLGCKTIIVYNSSFVYIKFVALVLFSMLITISVE